MTKQKKHIVFIVPDGVGIKNYLYSKLFKYIGESAQVTIWSPLPESAFEEVRQLYNFNFNIKRLVLQKESLLTRLFREASTYARLHYNAQKTNNNTILLYWKKPKHSLKLQFLYSLSERIGNWAKSNYNRILKLERLSKRHWSNQIINEYKSELKALKADTIFITHQRVAALMPICLAAKELHIKSVSAIFSWDNLPKARLCADVDYYLLWSQWMKKDMELFYPEIKPEQLQIVGTPQFEFYKEENRVVDRKEFAKKYNLNSSAHWICFSGDDAYTSPYDPNYLEDIAETISKLKEPVQLIFRRCPVDFSSRYDTVLNKYKSLIVSIDPIWHTDSKAWVGYFSKLADVDLQVNLAYHCDAVINLGSTMALDFATLDKPCLYLNYDTVKDANWSTKFIYKYHHFRSMQNLNAVGWINDKSEIETKIMTVINNPKPIGEDRKKWLQEIVLQPIDSNSKAIANQLL